MAAEEEIERMRLELEEQAMIEKKNASNMVAEALIAQEETTRQMNEKLEQKIEEIKSYEE